MMPESSSSEAIFFSSDEQGGVLVFAVVREATDSVYDRLIDAEDAVLERRPV